MSPRSNKQFEEVKEKSRQNILDASLNLFSNKGFFNTSIRQIAQKANISNGLLYNYFNSKEDLLIAIINNSFKLVDSIVVSKEELTASEKIESTINKFFRMIVEKNTLVRMMIQIAMQTEKFDFINKMIAKKYNEEVNIIGGYLKELGVENYKAEANILMATLDGVMIQSIIMKDSIPMDSIKEALIKKYKI